MFRRLAVLFILAAGLILSQPARAAEHLDFMDYFHELERSGRWMDTTRFGWVWAPYVEVSWRPFTTGHWVDTDEGMTWIAEEDWGWLTFHYGRWDYDGDMGWFWVPGDEWSPGWACWREGDDFIGWAPMPPSWIWMRGRGFLNHERFEDPDDFGWTFVNREEVFERDAFRRGRHRAKYQELLKRSRDITHFEAGRDERLINLSVPPELGAKWTGRPVKITPLVEASQPPQGKREEVRPDGVYIFRPKKLAPLPPSRSSTGAAAPSGQARTPPPAKSGEGEKMEDRRSPGAGGPPTGLPVGNGSRPSPDNRGRILNQPPVQVKALPQRERGEARPRQPESQPQAARPPAPPRAPDTGRAWKMLQEEQAREENELKAEHERQLGQMNPQMREQILHGQQMEINRLRDIHERERRRIPGASPRQGR